MCPRLALSVRQGIPRRRGEREHLGIPGDEVQRQAVRRPPARRARPPAWPRRGRGARRARGRGQPLLGVHEILDRERGHDGHARHCVRTRRASAVSASRPVMRVGAATARAPRAAISGTRSRVALVDHEDVEPAGVGAGDAHRGHGQPRHRHEPPRGTRHRLAADDGAHREDGGGGLLERRRRCPGTARMGPIEVMGLDGQTITAWASRRASSTPGAGAAAAGARVVDRAHVRLGLVAHEVLLEGDPPLGPQDARAHRLVGHGQHARAAPRARRRCPR